MDLSFLQIAATLLCFNSTPITTAYTEIGFSTPVKNQVVTPGDTLVARWDSLQAGCSTDGKAYLYIGLNKGDSCLGYVCGKITENPYPKCGQLNWPVPSWIFPCDDYTLEFKAELSNAPRYHAKSEVFTIKAISGFVKIYKDSTPQAIFWRSSGVFKWNFGGIADGFKIELLRNETSVKVLSENFKVADSLIKLSKYYGIAYNGKGSINSNLYYTLIADSTMEENAAYKLRISSLANPGISDTSVPFIIGRRPTFTVTSIDSGKVFFTSDTVHLQWKSEGVQSPLVALNCNNGTPVADSIPNTGTYTWVIPETAAISRSVSFSISTRSYKMSQSTCPPFSIDYRQHSLTYTSPVNDTIITFGNYLRLAWTNRGIIDSLILMQTSTKTSWDTVDSIYNNGYNSLMPGYQDRVSKCTIQLCEYMKARNSCFPIPCLVTVVPPPRVGTGYSYDNSRPVIKWHSISGIDSFIFKVWKSGTQDTIVKNTLKDTSYTFTTDLSEGYYYYTLQCIYGSYNNAVYSGSIRVKFPLKHVITTPENPTRNRRPQFSWNQMGTNITYRYRYWINDASGLVKGENTTNSTSIQVPSDLPAGPLYFSVESRNSKDSLIVDTLKITILSDEIPCPRPVAGKEMQKDSIVLRWLSVKNAHQYRIELFNSIAPTITAKQAAGAKPVPVHSEVVQDTMYSLPASLKDTTYFWRVSCDLNYEMYSPFDSFKVAPRKDIPVAISDVPVQSGHSNLKTGAVFRYNKGGIPEAIISNASEGTTELFVYSINGKRVFHSVLGSTRGVYRVDFSDKGAAEMRSGMYVALIKIGAVNLRKTFLIQ